MRSHLKVVAAPQECPWTPTQILGVAFLFGVGAAGTIAGVNFTRLGKREYLLPCILAGFALFVVEAAAWIFIVPPSVPITVAGLMNLGLGLGFMLAQRPYFDDWKAAHWAPASPDERYKPSHIGQLFLLSLLGLLIELALLVPLALIAAAR